MFWFCKSKPIDVYFYTTREDVFNNAKPQKAISFIPDWIKKLPKPKFPENKNEKLFLQKNINSCPGLIDLYKTGFMFSLWSDVNIEISPDGSHRYQFADLQSIIIQHKTSQFETCHFNGTHVHAKLINPWFIHSKEKVNFVYSAPIWNNFGHDDVVVAPGVFNPSVSVIDANINLFFKKKENEVVYELYFGQPLVHVLPISNRPINLRCELVTEPELNSMKARRPFFLMHSNRYRRTEKLCPHA